MFFRLTSFELGLMVFAVVLGTTLVGVIAGGRMHEQSEKLREPFGAVQAALLGLVALVLAGEALAGSPTGSAPRLYVDSLNAMIDMQTVRACSTSTGRPAVWSRCPTHRLSRCGLRWRFLRPPRHPTVRRSRSAREASTACARPAAVGDAEWTTARFRRVRTTRTRIGRSG